jgi:hypothetical protein
VRVLEDGRYAVGLTMAAVTTGDEQPIVWTADAYGQVTLPLSLPGQWLIKAIRIRPGEARNLAEPFTTLTVSVGGR